MDGGIRLPVCQQQRRKTKKKKKKAMASVERPPGTNVTQHSFFFFFVTFSFLSVFSLLWRHLFVASGQTAAQTHASHFQQFRRKLLKNSL